MKRSLTVAVVFIAAALFQATPAVAQRPTEAPRIAIAKLEIHRDKMFAKQAARRARERRAERRAAAAAAAAAAATPEPTTTTTTPTYSSSSSGSLYISEAAAASYMRAAGFPEDVIAWFNNGIIDRESNYCPTAVYPGHCGDVSYFVAGGPACSLFQLYPCPGPEAADPAVAASIAYGKYAKSGLSPWGG